MARAGSRPRLDYASEEREIVRFIRKTVAAAGANGVVLGLSGGVDSAVTGALCVKALGKEKVVAMLMPSEHTPREDIEDAAALAKSWGVRMISIDISPLADELFSSMSLEGDRVAKGNAQARIRMTLSYYLANVLGLLVAGTGDRSEEAIGFFTKNGDGGADFLPIAHLYKTQVRAMAERLGIPVRVATKPSSPRLWPDHLASDELPADYDKLDVVLHCLFDRRLPPARAAREAGVGRDVVEAVMQRHRLTAHKRRMPPTVRPVKG